MRTQGVRRFLRKAVTRCHACHSIVGCIIYNFFFSLAYSYETRVTLRDTLSQKSAVSRVLPLGFPIFTTWRPLGVPMGGVRREGRTVQTGSGFTPFTNARDVGA